MMDLYVYTTFPSPAHLEFTRVLKLAPGVPSDPLSGAIFPMSVVGPIPFEALSYVWGRGGRWDTIICDGKLLQITTSVATALRRLRDTTQHRVIWTDQVCINQKDPVERSQQVRHMGSLYQKASMVLVWLGNDEGQHASRAFALIKSLAAIRQDPLLLAQFQRKQLQGTMDWFPGEYWVSLGELFRQPWFDRKWVLQEIGTDAPSELLWGSASLNWDHVSKAAALLKDYGYALRRQYDLLVWKPWYMDKRFSPSSYCSKPKIFTYELHRARWQLASDPRDHIFALLGHPSAQEGSDGVKVIEADYTKPVEEVYHDFAVRTLLKGHSLMVLNTVQHADAQLSTNLRTLPTWVPQWDSQLNLHNLLGDDTCVYNSSGGIRPNPKFIESNRVLLLDGLVIDTISTTTNPFKTSDLTVDSPTLASVWNSLPECEGGVFTTAKKYRGGEPALFAFLETVSAIKKRKMQQPIAESRRLADGTDFLVKAFGTAYTIGDDVREMSRAGDCYEWMERASGGSKCRRFARGREGYYALCPPAAREGDELCLLLGGQTLFCLRPTKDSHLFVGECYVHGVMNGEALNMTDKGELTQRTFMIR
ncbi:HET-domain-containing protein [Hypoxylon crocopeplum]|nr:HET-domain-containing protein [Hypoxylon crocopeplum]